MAGKEKHTIRCASCGCPVDFFAPPMGPFCSSRCKMVDLGKWLGEEYKISEPLRPDHLAEYENMEGPDLDLPGR